jgi:hypothetical protein
MSSSVASGDAFGFGAGDRSGYSAADCWDASEGEVVGGVDCPADFGWDGVLASGFAVEFLAELFAVEAHLVVAVCD